MTLAPVDVTVVLTKPRAEVFAAFTRKMAGWWPLDSHSVGPHLGEPTPETVILEPHEGGRIYEVSPKGTQRDWGQITTWLPEVEIAFTWHPGRTADQATSVRVTFQDTDAGATVVTLVHSGWEILGEAAPGIRENYVAGWTDIIRTRFAAFTKA